MEILNCLIDFFSNYGYFAVFIVLLVCGFGVPIPEDVTLVAGGVICALFQEDLNIVIMLLVSLCGVLVGDGAMFMLGRILGPRVQHFPILKWIFTKNIYEKMQDKIHKYGNWILFVARFLPGLRAAIYITSGISRKVPYWKFFLMDGTAALISVPIWVYAGYYLANDLDHLLEVVKHSEVAIISGIALFIFILVVRYIVIKIKQKKAS